MGAEVCICVEATGQPWVFFLSNMLLSKLTSQAARGTNLFVLELQAQDTMVWVFWFWFLFFNVASGN